MKNYSIIVIIILIVIVIVLGILIIQKRQNFSQKKSLQSIENTTDVLSKERVNFGDFMERKELVISIDENTKIFNIAQDNPYLGEKPAAALIAADGFFEPVQESNSFQAFGKVVSIDITKGIIYISSNYVRPIATVFTPRGPEISLEEIKDGDYIGLSNNYKANGELDFSNIDLIQVVPALNE